MHTINIMCVMSCMFKVGFTYEFFVSFYRQNICEFQSRYCKISNRPISRCNIETKVSHLLDNLCVCIFVKALFISVSFINLFSGTVSLEKYQHSFGKISAYGFYIHSFHFV